MGFRVVSKTMYSRLAHREWLVSWHSRCRYKRVSGVFVAVMIRKVFVVFSHDKGRP